MNRIILIVLIVLSLVFVLYKVKKSQQVSQKEDVYGLTFRSDATPDEFLNWLVSKQFKLKATNGAATGRYLGGYWQAPAGWWWPVYKQQDEYKLGQYDSAGKSGFPLQNLTLNHYLKWGGDGQKGFSGSLNPVDVLFYFNFEYVPADNTWLIYGGSNSSASSYFGSKPGGDYIDWDITTRGGAVNYKIEVTSSITDEEKTRYAKYLGLNPNFIICRNGLEQDSYCRNCLQPGNMTDLSCKEGFIKSCSGDKILTDLDCQTVCLQSNSNPAINTICHNILNTNPSTNPCRGNDSAVCKSIYSKDNMSRPEVRGFWSDYCLNNNTDVNCSCSNFEMLVDGYRKYRSEIFGKAEEYINDVYDKAIKEEEEKGVNANETIITNLRNEKSQKLASARANAASFDMAKAPAEAVCVVSDCLNNKYPVLNPCSRDFSTNIGICQTEVKFSASDNATAQGNSINNSCNINNSIENAKKIQGQGGDGSQNGDGGSGNGDSDGGSTTIPKKKDNKIWIYGGIGVGVVVLVIVVIIILLLLFI